MDLLLPLRLLKRAIEKRLPYSGLLFAFVRRDINARYKGTVMGVLWSVINPMIMFSVYLLVFGFFLKVRMPNSASMWDFALYFSIGFFPWVFFNAAVVRAATSIVENRNYIKKVAFPAEIFPCAVVLSEAVSLLISIGIVLVFSLLLKGFSVYLFLLPLILVLEVLFALACAFFVSTATVFFRDIPQLLNSLFMVWFWLTPIAYTVDLIPKQLKIFVYLNPMHHILALYHSLLLNGTMLNMKVLAFFIAFTAVLFFFGVLLFRKAKGHFSDLL
ncbi:MAG: ABC transporter permease [bacterium]|nr:ABC transporter permease [bacterium]